MKGPSNDEYNSALRQNGGGKLHSLPTITTKGRCSEGPGSHVPPGRDRDVRVDRVLPHTACSRDDMGIMADTLSAPSGSGSAIEDQAHRSVAPGAVALESGFHSSQGQDTEQPLCRMTPFDSCCVKPELGPGCSDAAKSFGDSMMLCVACQDTENSCSSDTCRGLAHPWVELGTPLCGD